MASILYPGAVDRVVSGELLSTFPALLVVGPRGSGKSTSMSAFADTILDLSDRGPRIAVSEDPDGVLAASEGTVLIDEWQEAPDVLAAVKRAVDRDPRPGRFIVTGSVRAAHQAATWPGTGRLIRVRMCGLTQAELDHDADFDPIDILFAEESPLFARSDLGRSDYLDRLLAGRFPVVTGLGGRNRSRWYRAYVEQLVERDVAQITERAAQPAKLRAVLSSCAARSGQELRKGATAADADVDFRTADRALSLLEDLLIVGRIPSWHSNRLRRLTRTPKIHLSDPGMAAHLLSIDADSLIREPELVGQMFEAFVAAELVTHLETTSEETEIFHFRDRDGHEVDAILQRGGRTVGVEVKSSTRVDRRDASGLMWLRDRLGPGFLRGLILYAGELPFQIDDRIWAAPISNLWQARQAPTR